MCLASSVRLAYFLLRNVRLCCVYRCLIVPSVLNVERLVVWFSVWLEETICQVECDIEVIDRF